MAAAFFRAAPAGFADEHGLYLEHRPAYTATLCKDPRLAMYNSVYAFGVAAPITDDDLLHLVDLYKHAGCALTIRLSPYALPTEIPVRLTALGFEQHGNSLKLYRALTTVAEVPGPFTIEETGQESDAIFSEIACTGLPAATQEWLAATAGRVGWHHYLAYIGGQPVASGALYIEDGMGQLGWAFTRVEHRRKGTQAALLAYRIREAMRLGCTLLSADTYEDTPKRPNSSYHNMLQAGFQLAYARPTYTLAST